ncbi:MAG: hypothetical protein J1E62_02510 [Lachnospiraceae bacterium]|nr:hypothetical protein [Lachnospiraceae bacterium]
MKRIACIFTGICVILLSFCACSSGLWVQNGQGYSEDMGKWGSQLAGAFEHRNIACMDNTIVYPIEGYLCFYDTAEEKIVKIRTPKNEGTYGISAGKEFFYVLIIQEKAVDDISELPGDFYLRLYRPDGSLYKEVPVPFQRMYVSDGMVYGYWQPDSLGDYERKEAHIEATHYLSEEKFLTDFPSYISDWNEMEGDTMQFGSKTFYQYPADGNMHKRTYYCDDKYLNEIQQFYFTEYVDGELAVNSDRKMKERYLKQMYSMMMKKEKNWVTYAWEVEGTLYGVCNIYQDKPIYLTQMDTSSIDYSISFCYNESTDTLDKLGEYEDAELIYADGKCAVTHTVDAIYCIDLATGQKEKILDYDSVITVDVRDGLLQVSRLGNEMIGDSYVPVEQENDWGKGVLLVKKLW